MIFSVYFYVVNSSTSTRLVVFLARDHKMARFIKQYFTNNTTWKCPPSITEVLLIGCGGGGAGGGAGNPSGSAGGGGAIQGSIYIDVVPGKVYTITLGVGGVPATSYGTTTTFKLGTNTVASFLGATTSNGAFFNTTTTRVSGNGFGGFTYNPSAAGSSPLTASYIPWGSGGSGSTTVGTSGVINIVENGPYTGGANFNSGGGGGAGPQGSGGAGNNSSIAIVVAANSGAGGGGINAASATASNGANGYLYIIYVQ